MTTLNFAMHTIESDSKDKFQNDVQYDLQVMTCGLQRFSSLTNGARIIITLIVRRTNRYLHM